MKSLPRFFILFCLCFSFLLSSSPVQSQELTRGPIPRWVILHPVPEKSVIDPVQLSGGFHYLLVDVQRNLPLEQQFFHYAIRIISGDGIQVMSDVDVNYDPSYQSLQFNMVRVVRDGRIIDNLSTHEIKTFQRESGYDRHLLDGSLTAVINQENIRIGDVIEYAYTLTGNNPIHAGDFYKSVFQQFSIPIQQYNYRFIAPENAPLFFRYFNNAVKPDVQRHNGLIEYSWVLKSIVPLTVQDNTPVWYDPYPQVQISSQDQWAQVVKWALPLYSIDPTDLKALQKQKEHISPSDVQEIRILEAIRFVQNEVRYLGMESGLGAYRPNQPETVYQRRFGDCKDKSLLLTALLRNLGLEAWPVLVNSDLKIHVKDRIPSSRAFNHCIVKFIFDGHPVFVDPTISNQGGDLSHLAIPEYGAGLVIDDGVSDLEELPQSEPGTTNVEYFFTVKELGGPAELKVITTYGGLSADLRRGYFLSSSSAAISQSSLDFYSSLYPGIIEQKPLKLVNLTQNSVNLISSEEFFLIEDFWKYSLPDSSQITADFAPLEMIDIVDTPASAGRTAPFGVGDKLDISVNAVFIMPENWPVEAQTTEISSDDYSYFSELKGSGNRVDLSFHYRRINDSISAENTKSYIAEHDLIFEDLFLVLTHEITTKGFRFSWVALILAVATLLLGFVVFRKIHLNYDPAPLALVEEPLPFGGWLFLPLIGFSILPVLILSGGFRNLVLFNQNLWDAAISSDSYFFITKQGIFLGFEFFGGLLLFIYSVFVVFQFYKKRTSLPRFAIIQFLGSLILAGLNMALSYFFLNSTKTPDIISTNRFILFNTVFSAFIWIPYFLTSSRVKNTFVRQLHPTPAAISPQPTSLPASLPGAMIYSAVVLGIILLSEAIVFFNNGTLLTSFFNSAGTVETSGEMSGLFGIMLTVFFLPLVALIGILKRTTWARRLTIIIFSIVIFILLIIVASSVPSDTPEDFTSTLFGALIFATPLSIGLILLIFRSSSKKNPTMTSQQDSDAENAWDYPAHCHALASDLFEEIRNSFPGLKMDVQGTEPNQPIKMVIHRQTGIPRILLLDLQKTDALNLSIGAAWMTWKGCNHDGVRNDFLATVRGLLDGTLQLVEFSKDDELTGIEIRTLRDDKWETTHHWTQSRRGIKSGSTQQIIEFRIPEKPFPNED